jgi:adenine-specific DNA-methyltransferase
MMREILLAVRKVLNSEGSLWINLDETMSGYARMLLDSVFGRNCHVATIQWQQKYKPGQSRGIHTVHNPIIVYSKSPGWRRAHGMEPNAAHVGKYRNGDNDPLGRWRLTHNGEKTYLSELYERGAMAHTWWTHDDVGHTEQAMNEVKLECGQSFSTPKPLTLMKRIVHIATDKGDLVIDPMAGSGTTIIAAAELERRWLGMEKEQATVDRFILRRLEYRGWLEFKESDSTHPPG